MEPERPTRLFRPTHPDRAGGSEARSEGRAALPPEHPKSGLRRLADQTLGRLGRTRPGRVAMNALGGWWNDDIPRMGAALAYYTLFALAPVLIIAIAIGGLLWGSDRVRVEIIGQIASLMGPEGAQTIEGMLAAAAKAPPSGLVMIAGLATFFAGATGAFLELQAALDTVWRVTPLRHTNALRDFVTQRLISAGLVLGFAFLLLVALVISAALNALLKFASGLLPGPDAIWQIADVGISLVVICFLFAMIYKFMPYERLPWRGVWAGAAVAAGLFVLGKSVVGSYFAGSSFISSYGAAGSVIVVLVWVYWSTQILLFGAEVTRAVVQEVGSRPPPVSVGPRRIVSRA
ncbi:MAG TPA: YihY/virulence factor BrkB family protein [Candidatus Polarisedimenticolia bacterium]|nr:YihY/virulence factor BrkB family protein [Candidatus Polarisedimenticolia bacterium]